MSRSSEVVSYSIGAVQTQTLASAAAASSSSAEPTLARLALSNSASCSS